MSTIDRLERAWSRVDGWPYSRDVRFPSLAPGMPEALRSRVVADRGALDCSSLTAWILLTAYPRAHEQHPGLYGDLQVIDHARPWSPIDGVERAGIGSRAIAPTEPGGWYLLQSWRDLAGGRIVPPGDPAGRPASQGHARIAAVTRGGLRVWEATTRPPARVRATVLRGVGDIPGTTRCALLDTRDAEWDAPRRRLG